MTHEVLPMTCDTRHKTQDTQRVLIIVSKFQVSSSYGWELRYFDDLKEKGDSVY